MILFSPVPRPTLGTGGWRREKRAMSLVELLVVMAIISILLTFGVSAFRKVSQGSPLDNALAGVAAGMELARQTAISQSTYTWVALSEGKDESGANQISMAILASKSGDLADRGANDFTLISRVERFPGVGFGDFADLAGKLTSELPQSTNQPISPEVSGSLPISLDGLPNAATQDQRFTRLIMFTPQGGATRDGANILASSDVPVCEALQLVLLPSRGATPSETEKKSASVVLVNGVTGLSTVYRPL